MKGSFIDEEKVRCLFIELKEHTQQDETAYRAVVQLEELYWSHLENRASYESEEDRGKVLLSIAKVMMQINSLMSIIRNADKYLIPVRELVRKLLDEE